MSSIRRLLTVASALLGLSTNAFAQKAAAAGDHEASANFDAEDVGPVIARVAALLDSGLPQARVDDLTKRIVAQAVDSEKSYEYAVVYKGQKTRLRIVAFMDDEEAPDLAFFSSEPLIAAIDQVIEAYMAEVGK